MAQRGVELYLYSSKTSALEGGEGSASRPGRTLPPGKIRYPLYRRLGGPQGRSGRAENLAPTGIRSLDRHARSSVAIPTELLGPHMQGATIKCDFSYSCFNLVEYKNEKKTLSLSSKVPPFNTVRTVRVI